MEHQIEEKEGESVHNQLPQVRNWDGATLHQYQGYWLAPATLRGLVPFRRPFRALDSDVVLATFPKSGTIWIKALVFSIINRTLYKDLDHTHPLSSSNPHDLVFFLETLPDPSPLVDHNRPARRIFGTHLPYTLLDRFIRDGSCNNVRVVYMCRNPLDQFISSYHFLHEVMLQTRQHDKGDDRDALELFDEAFDLFCRGIQRSGPAMDHHLEYWKVSMERPEKVLFLKYEEFKEDTPGHIKRVAEFLGCPFSQEEESQGVIADTIRLCSYETMKDLEVNKTGIQEDPGFDNSIFFRKGEVGDWANYLSPSQAERAQKIVEEKLRGSGLTFRFK